MGIITDIAVQKKNKNRVSIFIDGSFYCGLDSLTALKHRLKIGGEIDESQLESVQADAEYSAALDKAFNRLSVRPRSRREIETYLSGKGYLPAVIGRVTERLTQLGYLDDEKYCRLYIDENKCRYGKLRLKMELKKRGVESETAEQALEETDFDDDTLNLARALLSSCGGDKYKLKNKLYRKGCDGGAISEALSELADEGAFDIEKEEE